MTDPKPQTPEQVAVEVIAEATSVPASAKAKAKAQSKAPAKARAVSTKKAATPAAQVAVTPAVVEAAPVAPAASAKAKAAKKATPVKAKKVAVKKPKLVRDSFTFPEDEYAILATLKQQVLSAGREVKKGELLRAGLAVLANMSPEVLLQALDGVTKLKPGRPAK